MNISNQIGKATKLNVRIKSNCAVITDPMDSRNMHCIHLSRLERVGDIATALQADRDRLLGYRNIELFNPAIDRLGRLIAYVV